MTKTICIYHKNCFDGICSAWVVHRWLSSTRLDIGRDEFRAFSYDMEFPFNEYGKDDNIIIVDFSFKRDVMEAIKRECKSLIVLDHHKTAQTACEELDFCRFDMNESGASLAWKYFFPDENVPRLVQYIRDRDLWQFKLHSSEIINAYIQSYPMEINVYEILFYELENQDGFIEAQSVGLGINRYKQTMVEAMCKNAAVSKEYPFYDDTIPTVNASMLFSEVGHELCKMYPNAPFTAYYFDRLKDGVRQWGLRSIGNYDVSEIAKKFGGGGHKNAAGFETSLWVI